VSEANVPVSRLLMFVGLCVLVGPILGTLVVLAIMTAQFPFSNFRSDFLVVLFLFGYLVGAPIALIAAVLFAIGARRLHLSGIGGALIGAIAAAAIVQVAIVVANVVFHDSGQPDMWRFRERDLLQIPYIAFVSLVAMTGCWYLGRALRILR